MEIEHARDLLQETIDALPAGVVLYDKDERLVMFNKAAASIAPHIARADAIGKTYSQMAYETERELDARGVERVEGAKEWIARFRSKGIRHLRPAPGGRWVEWLEKGTRQRRHGGPAGRCHRSQEQGARDRARPGRLSVAGQFALGHGLRAQFKGCLHVRQCRCHRSAGAAGRGRGRQALCRFPGRRGSRARRCRRARSPAVDGRGGASDQSALEAGRWLDPAHGMPLSPAAGWSRSDGRRPSA